MITMTNDMDLFRDWAIETDADGLKNGNIMSPCVKPLWRIVKRKLPRGERAALQSEDKARDEAKVGKPGSKERVAAYAEFYARNTLLLQSAFEDEV